MMFHAVISTIARLRTSAAAPGVKDRGVIWLQFKTNLAWRQKEALLKKVIVEICVAYGNLGPKTEVWTWDFEVGCTLGCG
jgi:hypothetical protein